MNKRQAVLDVLDSSKPQEYIPAGFFLHFSPQYRQGQAGVDKHLEFFRYTGMDFVKIQYEKTFPPLPEIQRPQDWAQMPFYGLDFYAPQLEVVRGLVGAAKAEALVLVTLYSPFMCANQTAGEGRLREHLEQDAESVMTGLQTITESLLLFVRACIDLGVDGFYASTQGGEAGRFSDPTLFEKCVRPYDLAIMREMDARCIFNILHVCDYHLKYADLAHLADYPGQVVNTSLELAGEQKITGQQVAEVFRRPFMGGLDRLGALATGSQQEVRQAVEAALQSAPTRTILAADCTVPGETPWDNLKLAIDIAHSWRGG